MYRLFSLDSISPGVGDQKAHSDGDDAEHWSKNICRLLSVSRIPLAHAAVELRLVDEMSRISEPRWSNSLQGLQHLQFESVDAIHV
jgi:hypothetical protein